jgi:hypothetical protein
MKSSIIFLLPGGLAAVASGIACAQETLDSSNIAEYAKTLEKPDVGMWRSWQRCGANCAYLLISLEQPNVSYEHVVSTIAISENGSSLWDIAECMEQNGCHVAVNQIAPEQLTDLTLPVIAHLDPLAGAGDAGHYVVVSQVSQSEGSVTVFDGVTGVHHILAFDEFVRRWSGYVIRIRSDVERQYWLIAAVAASGVALVLRLLWRPGGLRRRDLHA